MSEAKSVVPFVASSADPEVAEKAQRRKFSAEDKKRILEEVDRATGHGGIGAVLRREGIYSSTLHGWRKDSAETPTRFGVRKLSDCPASISHGPRFRFTQNRRRRGLLLLLVTTPFTGWNPKKSASK